MNINLLHDNTLIICENNYKVDILKKLQLNHLLLHVKFMTKKDFFKKFLFEFNEKTLSYLVNKYHYKVDIALKYLNNLYYINEDKKYQNKKLIKLVNLKKELNEQNLLIYNQTFKTSLSKYHILVLGYPYLENYEINIFDSLKAKIITDDTNYHHDKVLEFINIEDEVNYVASRICELIQKKIDVNLIKLTNVSEDYYNIITRIFNFYNIPVKFPGNNSLYSLEVTKIFLANYESDITKTIAKINQLDPTIVNKIINICNKYAFIDDYFKVKDLIIYDLKRTNIDDFNLENYVEITDLNSPFSDKNYVFIMNFNMGMMPLVIKDENYITDNIKKEINLKSTLDINQEIKKYTINKINNIKNVIITYKLNSSQNVFYPSSLISQMHLEKEIIKPDILNSYSKDLTKINYARKLDLLYKYGSADNDLFIYQNTFPDIKYNTYDNSYKMIDNTLLKNTLKQKLVLSYSSLDTFNKCAFRYYLKNILKLDKYEESFEAFIGSVFHDVLEKCFKDDLIVQEEINNYINKKGKILSAKEKFFVNKLVQDIEFVISILKKQNEHISFDKALYEKNINIDKTNDFPVEFTGFVDKILYKEMGDKTLVTIIDYKTGFVDIDLNYVPYGLTMQLPIYLYLVQKAGIFKKPIFTGLYFQNILDKNILRDNKKTYQEQKEDNLKLSGYSFSDPDILVKFDDTYQNSQLIKGMKIKNDGNFSAYAKVLDELQMNKLVELTEENINKAINEILEGKFLINPKKIGYDKDYGCKFCKFKDICFKKEKDYVIYPEIDNLDFLNQ